MSKVKRVFSDPPPKRTWYVQTGTPYAKRGMGAFMTFTIADWTAQWWARYKRLLIMDSKTDFDSPSMKGSRARYESLAEMDMTQTFRSAVFGGFFYAPFRLRWHQSMDKIWPLLDTLTPPERRMTLARRFCAEHFVVAPTMIAGYFVFQSVMEGAPLWDAPSRAFVGLPSTILVCWGLWWPVQAACWCFLPKHTWNAATAVVTLGWVTFMADQNRKMRHAVH